MGASGNSSKLEIFLEAKVLDIIVLQDGASGTNALGGVKMSFRQVGKKSDTEKNHGNDYKWK